MRNKLRFLPQNPSFFVDSKKELIFESESCRKTSVLCRCRSCLSRCSGLLLTAVNPHQKAMDK